MISRVPMHCNGWLLEYGRKLKIEFLTCVVTSQWWWVAKPTKAKVARASPPDLISASTAQQQQQQKEKQQQEKTTTITGTTSFPAWSDIGIIRSKTRTTTATTTTTTNNHNHNNNNRNHITTSLPALHYPAVHFCFCFKSIFCFLYFRYLHLGSKVGSPLNLPKSSLKRSGEPPYWDPLQRELCFCPSFLYLQHLYFVFVFEVMCLVSVWNWNYIHLYWDSDL